MTSFTEWKNEIADMPTRAPDGTWYDMETGLKYTPSKEPSRQRKRKPESKKAPACMSEAAQCAVEWAVENGFPVLTGTIRQRSWAEEIRLPVLKEAVKGTESHEKRRILEILKSGRQLRADYWIDKRKKTTNEILKFISMFGG